MIVIGEEILTKFATRYSDARKGLRSWLTICRQESWNDHLHVASVFPDVDFVGDCTVFNVRHNRYRLIAKIDFTIKLIQVRGVLTHAEYDRGHWKHECNCR